MDNNPNNQTAQTPTTATEAPATPPVKRGVNKVILIIGALVVIILGLAGYILFTNKSSVSTSSNTPTPSTAMTTSTVPSPSTTTSGMLIYASSDKKWQIMYPKDATAEKREATQIGPAGVGEVAVIYKLGPTQTTGTEFHDGYSVSVGTMKKPAATTLEKFADDQISTNPEMTITKTPYQAITVDGLSGITNVVNGMATFKFVYLQSPDDPSLVYYMAILAEGADKINYEKITEEILQSFKLL